jgi:hypothetical protein
MLPRVFGAMVLLGRSDMCGEVAIILNAMSRALIIFLFIMFAALTAACSSILPDGTAQIAAAPVGPPADYRKLIRTGVPNTLTNGAQVSELRKTVGPEPGDWMACLKSEIKQSDTKQGETTPAETKANIAFIAVFIEGETVKDFRRSVVIDQCESAEYAPLNPPIPPATVKKPPLKRK